MSYEVALQDLVVRVWYVFEFTDIKLRWRLFSNIQYDSLAAVNILLRVAGFTPLLQLCMSLLGNNSIHLSHFDIA
jgi:hypothetical protein